MAATRFIEEVLCLCEWHFVESSSRWFVSLMAYCVLTAVKDEETISVVPWSIYMWLLIIARRRFVLHNLPEVNSKRCMILLLHNVDIILGSYQNCAILPKRLL